MTDLKQQKEASEREAIEAALKDSNGHRKNAAAALGISVRSLYQKIAKYDLTKNKSTEGENHADRNEQHPAVPEENQG